MGRLYGRDKWAKVPYKRHSTKSRDSHAFAKQEGRGGPVLQQQWRYFCTSPPCTFTWLMLAWGIQERLARIFPVMKAVFGALQSICRLSKDTMNRKYDYERTFQQVLSSKREWNEGSIRFTSQRNITLYTCGYKAQDGAGTGVSQIF